MSHVCVRLLCTKCMMPIPAQPQPSIVLVHGCPLTRRVATQITRRLLVLLCTSICWVNMTKPSKSQFDAWIHSTLNTFSGAECKRRSNWPWHSTKQRHQSIDVVERRRLVLSLEYIFLISSVFCFVGLDLPTSSILHSYSFPQTCQDERPQSDFKALCFESHPNSAQKSIMHCGCGWSAWTQLGNQGS